MNDRSSGTDVQVSLLPPEPPGLGTVLHGVVASVCEQVGAARGLLLLRDATGAPTEIVGHGLSADEARELADVLGRGDGPADGPVARYGGRIVLAPVEAPEDETGVLVVDAGEGRTSTSLP